MPSAFNKCDGDVAKGWWQLGPNPSSTDLLVGVVAGPENAGVQGKEHDGCDVCNV